MVGMSIRKTAKKTAVAHRDSRSGAAADVPVESAFGEVVDLIRAARQRAHQAVNPELIGLYWQIGEYISAWEARQQDEPGDGADATDKDDDGQPRG